MAGREVHKYNESKKKEKDRYTFTINLTENEIGSLGNLYKFIMKVVTTSVVHWILLI